MTEKRRRRIVIVDDDSEIVDMLSRVVETFTEESFELEIETAYDGNEALDVLSSKPFDLMLVDFKMPTVNGEEVIKRLRKSDHDNAKIPIIVLSGYLPQMELDEPGILENVFFYDKPFSAERLVRQIKMCMR